MPVVANGEIWQVEDAYGCQVRSGCSHLMLGRGALATPDLAVKIKAHRENKPYTPLSLENVINHILHSSMHQDPSLSEKYFSSRTKQWLGYLKLQYPQANELFDEIRKLNSKCEVVSVLEKYAQRPSIDSGDNEFALK